MRFCYQMSLNTGYAAIPVAVGLTGLAIYGRVTSARSVVVMAAVCVAGIRFDLVCGTALLAPWHGRCD